MEVLNNIFLYKGIKINYREMGNGEPIILLHGFGGNLNSWRLISESLAGKNKLFLIDLKGFGLSDKPLDDKYSAGDQADIISDFIRKNKFQNLTLIGHSLGGAIALITFIKLMNEKNNPIKSLILISSPAYKQRVPEFTRLLEIPLLNKLLLIFLPVHFGTKIVLKRCFFDDKKISEKIIENYSDFLESAGSFHALITTAKKILPKNIDEITSKYKDIKIPVLLIWGENDQTIPLSIGQRLEKDLPNAKLVVIPECGHLPPEEKPQELVKIISEFLSKL